MVVSTTAGTARGRPRGEADLLRRPRPHRRGRVSSRSTTAFSSSTRPASTASRFSCSSGCRSSASGSPGAKSWLKVGGGFQLQPSEFARHLDRAAPRVDPRERRPRAPALAHDLGAGRGHRRARAPRHAPAGPRRRAHVPAVPPHGALLRRPPGPLVGDPHRVGDARRRRLVVPPEGLPEGPDPHVSRPEPRRARRGLPGPAGDASRSARAASSARAGSRGRRAGSASCPSATPTSSSRRSPRSGGSRASRSSSRSTASSIARSLALARDARDRGGSILVILLILNIAVQALVNVAMNVGVMPTTGITLPFVSYGGSSLVATWCMVGLMLSVAYRRYVNV